MTFKDNKGVEWDITLDAPSIKRVRSECDPRFMLGDEGEDNTYTRMLADPALLCEVVFILCAKQRQLRGCSEEDFYLNVIGNAIDDATAALLKAILSFTPRRTRELLETFAATHDRVQQAGTAKILQRISEADLEGKILATMDERLDKALGSLLTPPVNVTATPGSSASPPSG